MCNEIPKFQNQKAALGCEQSGWTPTIFPHGSFKSDPHQAPPTHHPHPQAKGRAGIYQSWKDRKKEVFKEIQNELSEAKIWNQLVF